MLVDEDADDLNVTRSMQVQRSVRVSFHCGEWRVWQHDVESEIHRLAVLFLAASILGSRSKEEQADLLMRVLVFETQNPRDCSKLILDLEVFEDLSKC